MRTPVSVGVIGLDRAGPKLAKALAKLPQAELRWLCDEDPERRRRIGDRHPHALLTPSVTDLLTDESLDAIVLATTDAATHYDIVRSALAADKHVLVEAPLAQTGDEADELVRQAERRNRRLSVTSLILFEPAMRSLKELVDDGGLGDVYYLSIDHAVDRHGTGDEMLWDSVADDLAVLVHLLEDQPVEAIAQGECYANGKARDVVFGFLRFATGITATLRVSNLDPRHLRRLDVVGSHWVAVLDDAERERKLTLYRGGKRSRLGDIVSPELDEDDAAYLACEQFLLGVRSSARALDNAREGAALAHVLSALRRSLARDGMAEPVAGSVADSKVIELPL